MSINIYEIEEEYKEDDIEELWIEDFRIFNIKRVLNNAELVSSLDRRIFLLYLEMGSLRKAEAVCGISHKTINEIYHRVRKTIIEHIENL